MISTHQLETTLRRLKLSGMLATLEARLDQARAGLALRAPWRSGELGHLEFLQVHRARFEEVTTLEEFDFSFNPKVPAAVIRDLAALSFVEASESIILYGPVGVGKSTGSLIPPSLPA